MVNIICPITESVKCIPYDSRFYHHRLETGKHTTELQIRGGIEDKSKIMFFLFLNENICCDPSLEPSQRDGSNDGSQNMIFLEKYG